MNARKKNVLEKNKDAIWIVGSRSIGREAAVTTAIAGVGEDDGGGFGLIRGGGYGARRRWAEAPGGAAHRGEEDGDVSSGPRRLDGAGWRRRRHEARRERGSVARRI